VPNILERAAAANPVATHAMSNRQPTQPSLRAAAAPGDAGQTMAEYSVMLGVITIAVVVALLFLSSAFAAVLSDVTHFI
jgi:Flp pilus assembly pilin Flp